MNEPAVNLQRKRQLQMQIFTRIAFPFLLQVHDNKAFIDQDDIEFDPKRMREIEVSDNDQTINQTRVSTSEVRFLNLLFYLFKST